MKKIVKSILYILFLHTAHVNADVLITDAWVRASAPGQSVGAAYMTIKSSEDNILFHVESTSANSVEIHSMTMTNGIMKMRSLEELPLQAGKPEKLMPGGFHFMLFDLKSSLKIGEKSTFTLKFKDKSGKISQQDITLPIKEKN